MAAPSEASGEKRRLRAILNEVLSNLPFHELIVKSEALSSRFFEWSAAQGSIFRGKALVSFYPFGSEPQVNIEREGRGEPYSVGYVRIEDWAHRTLSAREARRDTPDLWEEFEVGQNPRTKIFQPRLSQPLLEAARISAVLVPGLGFTREGLRLGRGAGFYDRFLRTCPEALRIGIAFEEQMLNSLPEEGWDERVDIVLTDRAIYPTNSYGEWQKQGKIKSRTLT